MKFFGESKSLNILAEIKEKYRRAVAPYQRKAKNCLTCETQGICCQDAHFVNVHITRLEAAAILKDLQKLDAEKRAAIFERIEKTIKDYDLKETGDTFAQTFACPLFEKGTGCLAHPVKPVPCIQHACYARREDLPPDELQTEVESKIERLNRQAYGQNSTHLPLPVWLMKLEQN